MLKVHHRRRKRGVEKSRQRRKYPNKADATAAFLEKITLPPKKTRAIARVLLG
jgi:hypothetical protein